MVLESSSGKSLDTPPMKFQGGVMHRFVCPCRFAESGFSFDAASCCSDNCSTCAVLNEYNITYGCSNKLLTVGRTLDVYELFDDLSYIK